MSAPNQWLDYVMCAIVACSALYMFICNLLVLYHRNFPLIRAKSYSLIITSSIGGIMWFWAVLMVNEHFARPEDTLWSVCVLWSYWMSGLGQNIWLSTLIIRLRRLECIFIIKQAPYRYPAIQLVALSSPIVLYSIFATIFDASVYQSDSESCKIRNLGWTISWGFLLLVPFVLLQVESYRVRNIRAEFNEYRELRNAAIFGNLFFIFYIICFLTEFYKEMWGRALITFLLVAVVLYFYTAAIVRQIYIAATDRGSTLEKFHRSLSTVAPTLFSDDSRFKDMVADPRFRLQLKEFALRQLSAEMVEFFEAVDQRKRTINPNERVNMARNIIKQFIQEGSPQEINIESICRQQILKQTDMAAIDLFDQAELVVLNLLKENVYVNMMNQAEFKEWKEEQLMKAKENQLLTQAHLI